jgi:predicted Zn-dependent protease with MMP-like domain
VTDFRDSKRPAPAPRRRDRRGRGMRGPLAPSSLPMSRTRAELFDDLVLEAVEHLEHRWHDQLERVQFAVEDVPPIGLLGRNPGEPVPLGSFFPQSDVAPAQIVVYRRPIEARAGGSDETADLVHDVVVEEVADLLGLDPRAVDPRYGEGWDDDADGGD